MQAIVGGLGWLSQQISQGILSAVPSLTSSIASVGPSLTSGMQWVSQQIVSSITSSISQLQNTMLSSFTSLAQQFQAGLSSLSVGISSFTTVTANAFSAAGSTIASSIQTSIAQIAPAVTNALTPLFQAVSGLPGLFTSGFQSVATWFWSQASAFGSMVATQIVPGAVESLWSALRGFAGWMSEKASGLFSPVLDVSKSPLRGSPSEVVAGASKILMSTLAGFTLFEITTCAVELIHPLKYMGVGGSVGASIGSIFLGGIIGGIVGAMLGPTVTTPLRYALNEMYPIYLPRDYDLADIGAARVASRSGTSR